MAVPRQKKKQAAEHDDDWTLTADQMTFMFQHHNAIESAYASDDLEFLRQLAESDEYISVFGDMGWDEAYDRYETTLDEDGGNA